MRRIFLIFFVLFFSFYLYPQKSEVEKLLEEGKKAYAEGRFQEAISKLNLAISLIQNKQKLVDAYLNLGLTYFTIGKTELAKDALKKALAINPRLVLDPEYFPPKFLTLTEEVRRDFIVNIKLQANVTADFEVDGELVGRGMLIPVSIPKGKHTFTVSARGYKTVKKELDVERDAMTLVFELAPLERPQAPQGVKVSAGKKGGSKLLYYLGGAAVAGGIVALLASRKKAPSTAKLTIETEPSGALVEIDGREVGVSPLSVDVSPGSHRIKAELKVFGEASKDITVEKGKQYEIKLELAPYKYKLDKCYSFSRPISVTIDDEGKIYVTDRIDRRVYKLSSSGDILKRKEFDEEPWVITFSESEHALYLALHLPYYLVKLDTGLGEYWRRPLPFKGSSGMTTDKKGSVYVGYLEGGKIYKFSNSGDVIKSWDAKNPTCMTIMDETLYVTSLSPEILKFSLDGKSQGKLKVSGIKNTTGIGTDGVCLYVTDSYDGSIHKIFPNGEEVLSFGGGGSNQVVTLAVDKKSGDVWVARRIAGKVCHWSLQHVASSKGKIFVKAFDYEKRGNFYRRKKEVHGKVQRPSLRRPHIDKRRRIK